MSDKAPTTLEQIEQTMADARGFVVSHTKEQIKPLQEEMQRVDADVKKAISALRLLEAAKAAQFSHDGRLRVRSGRLTGMDLFSLKCCEVLARDIWSRHGRCATLVNEVLEQRKALHDAVTLDHVMEWEDIQLKKFSSRTREGMFSPAMFRQAQQLSQWRDQMAVEVRKALDSTTAAKGDELVPTFESAELWMDVNLDSIILPLLTVRPMPTNPYDIPIQFGDTNWYPIDENIQVTTTDPATNKVTLTAYGLKTGVPFSDELEEDAIIALVPELRASLVRNAADVLDDILLNGDTTALNGINSDGATISKSTAGKGQWLLGFDGLIHLALVDNSANQSLDKAAAIDADVFNRVLTKMGKYALPKRRGDVVFVSDVPTSVRALSITEFETMDVAGPRFTLSSGEILGVYGKPYVATDEMRQADVDGKVTDTGNATTTLGRILAVNTSQWAVGFRRQITVEASREAGKGQTVMYVSFRIALTERSGTRSTAKHAAIAYNITGVS